MSELYRPARGNTPESRIPLVYDWYGSGGWKLFYVPSRDVSADHMALLSAHMDDVRATRDEQAVKRLTSSLLSTQQCEQTHHAMEAHREVREITHSHDTEDKQCKCHSESKCSCTHTQRVQHARYGRNYVLSNVMTWRNVYFMPCLAS